MVNTHRRQLFEGKTKILYEGPEPETLVVHYKDDVSSSQRKKKAIIDGKGIINNRITEFFMNRLAEIGIPTHFVRRLNSREQLVHEVDIIPVEMILHNAASGYLSDTLGIPEGTPLPRSIMEYSYKNVELGDPMVTEEHITAFNWATVEELDEMVRLTLRINDYMTGLLYGLGIRLVDVSLEFGRLYQEDGSVQVVLADEISPDNCRLWDIRTKKKLDKDRFRKDLGNPHEAYLEVASRLGVLPESLEKEFAKSKEEFG